MNHLERLEAPESIECLSPEHAAACQWAANEIRRLQDALNNVILPIEDMEGRNPRVVTNLCQAITIMRDACDKAYRSTARGDDASACREVMHSIAWGNANASSAIETAFSALSDGYDTTIFKLEMKNKEV